MSLMDDQLFREWRAEVKQEIRSNGMKITKLTDEVHTLTIRLAESSNNPTQSTGPNTPLKQRVSETAAIAAPIYGLIEIIKFIVSKIS